MAVNRPNVELHIEELVLHGFAQADRRAITAAIEAELGRLLSVQGLPASFEGGPAPAVRHAGSFDVARASAPSDIGQDIGRAVYEGLGHE